MFKTAFADITQKFLQMRNVQDAAAAKSLQRIVGELTFADIAADFPFAIIRRNAYKPHRAGLHSPYACAKRIFLAYCPGNDLLEIHAHILEEMLGKIAAVETNGLVGIIRVVVIPVQQRAGSFGSQLKRMHAYYAGNIDFASAGHAFVAHHAHHRAGHDPEIFFERSPALNGTDDHFGILHPAIDHGAQLGHLEKGGVRNALSGNVPPDGLELFLRDGVVVFHARDTPKNFREINGLDGDAVGFEDLFTVPHGIECRRPRANRADAQPAQAFHNAAYAEEPFKVAAENVRLRLFGMECRQRIRNAILCEIIASRHLAAKTVAAVPDGHPTWCVGRGLYQDGHRESRHPQRIGDGSLVTKVRQSDHNSVDRFPVMLEQVRAAPRFLSRFYGAKF